MLNAVTENSVLRALYDYWKSCCAGRAMPDRRDIDPTSIPPFVLPHIMMFDLGGDRFRYRLVGTAITATAGRDYTGRYLDEVLSGDYLAYTVSLLRELESNGKPIYTRNHHLAEGAEAPFTVERLIAPLASGAGKATIALIGHICDEPVMRGHLLLSKSKRRELARTVVTVAH